MSKDLQDVKDQAGATLGTAKTAVMDASQSLQAHAPEAADQIRAIASAATEELAERGQAALDNSAELAESARDGLRENSGKAYVAFALVVLAVLAIVGVRRKRSSDDSATR